MRDDGTGTRRGWPRSIVLVNSAPNCRLLHCCLLVGHPQMVASVVFLIPVCLAFLAIAPALYLGRAQPQNSRRRTAALIAAVILNGVAFLLTSRMSYLVVLAIPFFCFCIAGVVGGVMGRRAWLFGLLASPWFVAPYVVDWVRSATPDEVTAYGRIPWEMVYMTLPFGAAGSIAAEIAIAVGTSWKLDSSRDAG